LKVWRGVRLPRRRRRKPYSALGETGSWDDGGRRLAEPRGEVRFYNSEPGVKLVIGLGNPGRRYERTRHNVGFWVVDRVAEDCQAPAWTRRFDGWTTGAWIGGENVVLLKPATFMNRSGRSARQAVDFYKIDPASLLVVCDDFALNLGRIRLRPGGSSGGQNGLKDVAQHLGTEAFPRLRVGIGPPGGRDGAEYVLSDFSADERKLVEICVVEAARAVERWCRDGLDAAMNEYNGKHFAKE
jgi:PTH1 family peptidyl-tRNA hydrolase